MHTSKSYVARPNNVKVKLELEDLEYVLSDGQKLIINPDSTSDDAEDGNIVYTDGSRAVVLQTGVKHYIQTLGGETYLLGNDAEQLVINSGNQSEESNSAIELVQNDVNGETVIYELADTEGENVECEQPSKRFKIGNTEYVTLEDSDSLQVSNDDQFSVLNENSISETSNYQYAILKDGKLHLQLCNEDSIEILDEDSVNEIEHVEVKGNITEEDQEYVDDNDKVEEYVLLNTDLSEQNNVDLSKIAGRDFLTGKTIVWDNYLNQLQYKVTDVDDVEDFKHESNIEIQNNNENYDQFLNRKLLIRKNSNGKSLFGKILHIQPARKETLISEEVQDISLVEIAEDNEKQGDTIEADIDNNDLDTITVDDDDSQAEVQELLNYKEHAVNASNSSQIEYNQDVTEELVDFITKTLCGSLGMPSLKEKLLQRHLEIKYVEKWLDGEGIEVNQKVHYVSGRMAQEGAEFILDNTRKHKNVTSLTIISCSDPNDQKTTKVIFHEKHNIPQTASNLQSMNILNKHYQPQKCSICHQRFANYSLLNEHRKSTGHYLRCTKCNKRFKNDSALRRHQKVHAKLVVMKQLQCATCKIRFSNVSTLSKHLLMHNRLKSYQCDTCGKSFKTFGEMNAHRKFHNHHCDICGREFSRHSNLLRHVEIHKGEGDLYKCGICDCSYKFISTLTRHVVQNHMKQ